MKRAVIASMLCAVFCAFADGNLPPGTEYFGRIRDKTPVVTNAWESVEGQVAQAIGAALENVSTITTNDVCNIVTNEAVEFTPWEFRFSTDAVAEAAKGWNLELEYRDGMWYFSGVGELPLYHSWEHKSTAGSPDDEVVFVDWFIRNSNDLYWVSVTATRSRIVRHSLGLARLKDIEPLPTYEAVTNTARSVVNTLWDDELGVAWEARMHNGHLYYIAVTNVKQEVTQ